MVLQLSELDDKALVHRINKNANKAHLCGVPVFIVTIEDTSDSIRT